MDNTNDRDKDLDKMLGALRKVHAAPDQINAWNAAVKSAQKRNVVRWYQVRIVSVPQLAFALILGFAVGALSFKQQPQHHANSVETSEPTATIEQIYAKAE